MKQIENEFLCVGYDESAGIVSLIDKVTGNTFVTEGRFEGGGGLATGADVHHARFGDGQVLSIEQESGSHVSLEVYPELPFVLLRRTLRNNSDSVIDIPVVSPVTFKLDLGVSPDVLRTLGTGGLLRADENPGSYVFLACADPDTRRGVVAGWLTHERGSGVLFSSVVDGVVEFRAQIDYGHLKVPAGATETLETLAIGVFDDARLGLEQFADAVKKQYAIQLRPQKATYCTWYAERHGGAGDEASTVELATFAAEHLKPYGLEVVLIDDQWQDGPELDGPTRGFDRVRPDGPYPNGIAPVAQEVDARGMTLGLWWLPFGRNHTDPEWSDRQDWFARWADGALMKTRTFGGTCLDLTHPAVQEHLGHIARLYRSWGVRYYKMDGLWTGTATEITYINDGYADDRMSNVAPFHDSSKTQIEAYRDGLKLLRHHAGDDVFFSGCNVSQGMRCFGGSFGLVDAMRVGPDFNHDGLGIKTGPIRATRLYFLNGRVWWNDPDPAKVRASDAISVADIKSSGAVSLEMARLTTSFTAITGQFFLLSDWLPDLPPDRVEILKRTMLAHDAEVRPVDYFDQFLPSVWLVSDDRSGVRRDVIGLFNWENESQEIGATLAKADLDPKRTYHAFDFWEGNLLPDVSGEFRYELPPASCRIIALRAAEDRPVLLSTSRHITQGVVDVLQEQWDGHALSGTSVLIAGDPYELRIRVPEGWGRPNVNADVASTVELEEGLVRITLESSHGGETSWRAAFS